MIRANVGWGRVCIFCQRRAGGFYCRFPMSKKIHVLSAIELKVKGNTLDGQIWLDKLYALPVLNFKEASLCLK